MSNIDKLKKRADAAAKRKDQTKATKGGGGDYTPPAEGRTGMRLLEYIELGVQPQGKYKGQDKKPAASVQIAFELLGKKHMREIKKDDGEVEVRGTLFRIFPNLALSSNEKSKFFKLLKLMRSTYSNPDDITHMSQMIGAPFMGVIRNRTVEANGEKRTYSNLTDESGNFAITGPVIDELDDEGEVVSRKKIKVPDLTMTAKLFFFDEPTMEDWNALDEKTQERIKAAKNFKGSAVEQMLAGLDDADVAAEDDEDEAEDDADDLDEDDEEEVAPPKKAAKGKKAPTKDEDEEDDLDEEVEDLEDEEEEAEDEEVEEEEEEEEEKPKAKAKGKKSAKPATATSKKSATAKTGKTAKDAKTASHSKAKGKKAKPVADDLDDLIDDED